MDLPAAAARRQALDLGAEGAARQEKRSEAAARIASTAGMTTMCAM